MDAHSERPAFLTQGAFAVINLQDDCGPAPPGAVEASRYGSAQAGVPVYMRAGIWPVNHRCGADLGALGRTLPAEWRDSGRLQRNYLCAADMSGRVADREVTHLFPSVMANALWHGAVERTARQAARIVYGGRIFEATMRAREPDL